MIHIVFSQKGESYNVKDWFLSRNTHHPFKLCPSIDSFPLASSKISGPHTRVPSSLIWPSAPEHTTIASFILIYFVLLRILWAFHQLISALMSIYFDDAQRDSSHSWNARCASSLRLFFPYKDEECICSMNYSNHLGSITQETSFVFYLKEMALPPLFEDWHGSRSTPVTRLSVSEISY